MKTTQHTQHTPGPWTYTAMANGNTWVQVEKGDTDICTVLIPYPHAPGMGPDDGTIQNANARLIATAPELLEALEKVGAILDQPVTHSTTRTSNAIQILRADAKTAIIVARAAIAKAKGKS